MVNQYICQIYNVSTSSDFVASNFDYSLVNVLVGNSQGVNAFAFTPNIGTIEESSPYSNIIDTRRVLPTSMYIVSQNNNLISINTFPYNPLATQTFTLPTNAEFITFGGENIYYLSNGNIMAYTLSTQTTQQINVPISDITTTDALDIGQTIYWKTDSLLFTYSLTSNTVTNSIYIPTTSWLDMFSSMPFVFGSASGRLYLYSIFENATYLSTIQAWTNFYYSDVITVNNVVTVISSGELITNYFNNTLPNVYAVLS